MRTYGKIERMAHKYHEKVEDLDREARKDGRKAKSAKYY
jgi:hypothetical protein